MYVKKLTVKRLAKKLLEAKLSYTVPSL